MKGNDCFNKDLYGSQEQYKILSNSILFPWPQNVVLLLVFESGGSGRNSLVEYLLLQGLTNNAATIQRLLHDLQGKELDLQKTNCLSFYFKLTLQEETKINADLGFFAFMVDFFFPKQVFPCSLGLPSYA